VQNDVRRLAECGKKKWLQVQNVRAKMIGHCAEDNFPTFKVSSVANPKQDQKGGPELELEWAGATT
jgi:hypothetical protein